MGGWGVKLEVLRLLVALTTNWRRVVQPHMPALLQHCWTLLHSCLPIYLAAVVLQQEDLDEGLVRRCLIAPSAAVACCAWTASKVVSSNLLHSSLQCFQVLHAFRGLSVD